MLLPPQLLDVSVCTHLDLPNGKPKDAAFFPGLTEILKKGSGLWQTTLKWVFVMPLL
jgi:hypothetical protein